MNDRRSGEREREREGSMFVNNNKMASGIFFKLILHSKCERKRKKCVTVVLVGTLFCVSGTTLISLQLPDNGNKKLFISEIWREKRETTRKKGIVKKG